MVNYKNFFIEFVFLFNIRCFFKESNRCCVIDIQTGYDYTRFFICFI